MQPKVQSISALIALATLVAACQRQDRPPSAAAATMPRACEIALAPAEAQTRTGARQRDLASEVARAQDEARDGARATNALERLG